MKCMSMLNLTILRALVCGLMLTTVAKAATEVSLEHEVEVNEENRPWPRKNDVWKYTTDNGEVKIYYRRLLTPGGGQEYSLPNAETGVGFDGLAFGNWYRNNAIRVLVNGKDVMALSPASSIKAGAGERGTLKLEWETPGHGGVFRLSFVIAGDGETIYVMGDLTNFAEDIRTLEIALNAYPGGYSPSYGGKSYRMARTARQSGEVPPEAKDDASAFPTLKFGGDESWVFLSDKIANGGALGLLLLPKEGPEGELKLSSYTTPIKLRYPKGTMTFRIALSAYAGENETAFGDFRSGMAAQHAMLESWAEDEGVSK